MARSPAIRGRPAPQRKHKSSAATAASSAAASLLPTRTPITKALKRAQKRASLLQKTGVIPSGSNQIDDDEHQSARALLQHGGSLSKSALRRRKRKERDELAKDVTQGRQGGIKELTDAVEELEEEIMEADEEPSAQLRSSKDGRITANHRKRVLQEEQERQKAILSNPAFQASPFAALRAHLQNASLPSSSHGQRRTRR